MHRHRVAPQVAADLETLFQTGQLVIHAGRVQSYQEAATGVTVTFRQRQTGTLKTLGVEFVVNCTGPNCNYRKLTHPLIVHLLKAGLIQPDPLGLGVEVTALGAQLDAKGVASNWLYTLGSPQKGCLWETTAVPEIWQQAIALSQILMPGAVQEIAVP